MCLPGSHPREAVDLRARAAYEGAITYLPFLIVYT